MEQTNPEQQISNNNSNNNTVTHKSENQDSIELGTPAKGGGIKVYFDAAKPEDAQIKIQNAIKLRQWANTTIESGNNQQ